MYIEKYWGNYIGGTDDSLTLLDEHYFHLHHSIVYLKILYHL